MEGRGRGRPRKPITYQSPEILHVTGIRMPDGLWKALKHRAIRDNTTVSALINEALSTWLRWLCKAELKDVESEEERAALDAELQVAVEAWKQTVMNQRLALRKKKRATKFLKAIRNRHNWVREFPDRPWPGLKCKRYKHLIDHYQKALADSESFINNVSTTNNVLTTE